MKTTPWFEREFKFGLPPGMLPFFQERLSYISMRMDHRVKGMSDNRLSKKFDGKWSVKQNIGHLADVDEIAMKRIHEMLSGKPVMSPAVFESKEDYHSMSIADVIELFKKSRAANLEVYKRLTVADLTKNSTASKAKDPSGLGHV